MYGYIRYMDILSHPICYRQYMTRPTVFCPLSSPCIALYLVPGMYAFALVFVAVGIACPDHLGVFSTSISVSLFVACDHISRRARLSGRYRQGHWLCWM